MFSRDQYQLLDFGEGEKLESFGRLLVSRETPSVAMNEPKSAGIAWNSHLRFRRQSNSNCWTGSPDDPWRIQHGSKIFLLKPTPAGQIGVFPEQAANWAWIESLPGNLEGLTALNLFGYTGGTTMALASRGASVVHVDSAANVMNWARANATASGMNRLPIRWIVEDAMKFVQREIKRESRYNIFVADPPSYGKGPKTERWKFADDFQTLLSALAEIASTQLCMIMISCHTPGFDASVLKRLVSQCFHLTGGDSKAFELQLRTATGRRLASGSCFRYCKGLPG